MDPERADDQEPIRKETQTPRKRKPTTYEGEGQEAKQRPIPTTPDKNNPTKTQVEAAFPRGERADRGNSNRPRPRAPSNVKGKSALTRHLGEAACYTTFASHPNTREGQEVGGGNIAGTLLPRAGPAN
jgi:hypothetical protein